MLRFLRNVIVYGGLASAVLAVLFVAGFLQELQRDDLKGRIAAAGLMVPLENPWIEVIVQNMSLTLFDGDVLIKRYDIGYGRDPVGLVANRRNSTPLGEFTIVAKQKRHDILGRGSRFLRLDYPTAEDGVRAYQAGGITDLELDRILAAERAGDLPPTDTDLGGPLGIQGNFFFFRERRFTDGSIALSNGDLNELYEYVPVGTRVVIKN